MNVLLVNGSAHKHGCTNRAGVYPSSIASAPSMRMLAS